MPKVKSNSMRLKNMNQSPHGTSFFRDSKQKIKATKSNILFECYFSISTFPSMLVQNQNEFGKFYLSHFPAPLQFHENQQNVLIDTVAEQNSRKYFCCIWILPSDKLSVIYFPKYKLFCFVFRNIFLWWKNNEHFQIAQIDPDQLWTKYSTIFFPKGTQFDSLFITEQYSFNVLASQSIMGL